jgi:hypothetical protein
MKSMRRMIGLLLALFIMVSSACSISVDLTPTPATTQSQEPIPSTTFTPAVPPDTPTQASESACPVPGEGQLLFTLDEPANPFALCFLYPADFTVKKTLIPNNYTVSGAAHGEGEPMAGSVSITFEPAGGKSLENFSADTVALQAPGMGLALTPMTVGESISAIRVDGIPGITGTITLFMVQNDTAFTLTFMPADTIPEAVADMQRLYDIMTASWVYTR